MRKIIFTLAALLSGLSAFLQTSITVDFGIIQNGSQLVLDSVLVENQTTSCDTVIYNLQTGLTFDVISGIGIIANDKKVLSVMQNYPNPCIGETIIETWLPGNETEVSIFDVTGKLILSKKYRTGKGNQIFSFTPGRSGNFIVLFKSQGQEASIVVTSNSLNKSDTSIIWNGTTNLTPLKTVKSSVFIYNLGDILKFTAYVTACNEAVCTSISDSPAQSQTYNFNFCHLTDIQPESPVVNEISTTQTSIAWSWFPVENADGYKAHIENDIQAATDLETYTSLTFNTVLAGSHYNLYVWAYNECGASFPVHLDTCTQAMLLTQDEIDLIQSGASTEDMGVMIFANSQIRLY